MPSTPSLTAVTGVPHQASHQRGWSASTSAVTSAVARDQFEILYPNVRGFLLSQFTAHSMPQDAIDYFTRVCNLFVPFSGAKTYICTKCLDYNTFSGKYKTGLLVVEAAEAFRGRELNDSEYEKAAILGWAIVFVSPVLYYVYPIFMTICEQLHSYFLVTDNLVDQVTTSHGKQSWHCVEGVGLKAINDSLLLEGAVFQLVREHFRNESYYIDLLELIHETRHPSFFRNPIPVSSMTAIADEFSHWVSHAFS